jgi:hypothetical protein
VPGPAAEEAEAVLNGEVDDSDDGADEDEETELRALAERAGWSGGSYEVGRCRLAL